MVMQNNNVILHDTIFKKEIDKISAIFQYKS